MGTRIVLGANIDMKVPTDVSVSSASEVTIRCQVSGLHMPETIH